MVWNASCVKRQKVSKVKRVKFDDSKMEIPANIQRNAVYFYRQYVFASMMYIYIEQKLSGKCYIVCITCYIATRATKASATNVIWALLSPILLVKFSMFWTLLHSFTAFNNTGRAVKELPARKIVCDKRPHHITICVPFVRASEWYIIELYLEV